MSQINQITLIFTARAFKPISNGSGVQIQGSKTNRQRYECTYNLIFPKINVYRGIIYVQLTEMEQKFRAFIYKNVQRCNKRIITI